jgi:hypothetical protein
VHKQEVVLHPNIFQHEQKNDHCMHFFEVFNDGIIAEDKDQPTENKFDVPRFFLVHDIADVVDLPKYDEYNDNYEVDFLEHPTECSSAGNVQFQQFKESIQPAHFSYDNYKEHEESTESGEGNTLSLCFSSFQILKENFHSVISQQFHSYDNKHGENNEFTNENSFPL